MLKYKSILYIINMSKIILLDESTIAKIAAGEVIERPMSVVKELVENSLDANANEIIIKLKEAGKKQITVVDNGFGIDKEDLLLSCKKHATSKIKNVEDIFNVLSYGFRGEALATIAEVSKMEIISGTKNSQFSYKLNINNKEILPDTKYIGTTVNVYNLFYNIPARQKFLKSDSYELKKTVDWVKNISISNFDKNIKLYHNDKLILDYPKQENISNRIKQVYNLNTIFAEFSDPIVKTKIYFTNPTELKEISFETIQNIYLNNRPINNKTILYAISKAFDAKIPKNRKPNIFVLLELNPKTYDINVHPQKFEVRLKDNNTFFYPVYHALKSKLEQGLDKKDEEKRTKILSLIAEEDSNYFKSREFENIPANSKFKKDFVLNENQKLNLFQNNNEVKKENFKIIGQYNKTFILIEDVNESLMLIDQHVAEERYYFEKLLEQYENQKLAKQELIAPINLEFTKEYLNLFLDNLNLLNTFGFDVSVLNDTLLIRSIPLIFNRPLNNIELKELLLEIINNMENKNILEAIKIKTLSSLACKASIKADTLLGEYEMKKIINNLFSTKNPYTCPHGRPIIIELTKKELYKKIGRL